MAVADQIAEYERRIEEARAQAENARRGYQNAQNKGDETAWRNTVLGHEEKIREYSEHIQWLRNGGRG